MEILEKENKEPKDLNLGSAGVKVSTFTFDILFWLGVYWKSGELKKHLFIIRSNKLFAGGLH